VQKHTQDQYILPWFKRNKYRLAWKQMRT